MEVKNSETISDEVKDLLSDYRVALSDLKDIARSKIDCLTMISGENREHADLLSREIHEHILNASTSTPARLLPLVYVMDSVVKTIKGKYLVYFEENVVDIFSLCWRVVDDKTRERLKKLAMTWKGVFSDSTVAAVEKICGKRTQEKAVEKAPISAYSIPVQQPNLAIPYASQSQVNLLMANLNTAIRELQKYVLNNSYNSIAQSQLTALKQILTFTASTALTVAQFEKLSLRTTAILSEIKSTIVSPKTNLKPTPISPPVSKAPFLILEIPFNQDSIDRKYPRAYIKIYEEIPLQCETCAQRFYDDEVGRQRMQAHMEWHARVTRRLKERGSKAFSRDWFQSEQDWICTKNADTTSGQLPSFFDVSTNGGEREKESSSSTDEEEEIIDAVPMDSANKTCEICHEKFSTYWDEEEEEWMLKDAMKVEDTIYHVDCYRGSRPRAHLKPRKRQKMDGSDKE